MPAFTKGKWIDCGDYTIGVEDENGYIKYYICECESVDFHITDEEVRANARLIAAAPNMYWLLKSVLDGSAFEVDIHGHYIFTTKKAEEFRKILKRIDGTEATA